MAWAIRRDFCSHLQDISWLGRAGSILLAPPRRSRHMLTSLYAVGVHGAHGDSLLESLTNVVALIRRKPRQAELIVLGDFNIDLLPSLEADPWRGVPQRSEFHQDRR